MSQTIPMVADNTLTVTYDGHVLQPDHPLLLVPGTRYVIFIVKPVPVEQANDVWDVLEALTGAIEAPADWASEHDHYLYGTSKRGNGVVE